MKKTAVEWLENEIAGLDTGMSFHYFEDKIQQAKEMEKQQIIDALKEGVNFEIDNSHSTQINYKKHFEKYYNETFKNQLQG